MNVNTATEEELRELPGVGEKTAAKIVASRPIGSREEFEALIPPSALVAIEKEGLELAFDVPIIDKSPSDDGDVYKADAPIFVEGSEEPGPATMVPALVGRSIEPLTDDQKREALERALVETAAAEIRVAPVLELESGLRIRRVLHQDTQRFESLFGTGTRFLCIWNMQWGPALEALVPSDGPVQEEIAMWFGSKGIEILFAHYGPSVSVGTRSRGFVPLVLFEILEEKEEEENVEQSAEDGQ